MEDILFSSLGANSGVPTNEVHGEDVSNGVILGLHTMLDRHSFFKTNANGHTDAGEVDDANYTKSRKVLFDSSGVDGGVNPFGMWSNYIMYGAALARLLFQSGLHISLLGNDRHAVRFGNIYDGIAQTVLSDGAVIDLGAVSCLI